MRQHRMSPSRIPQRQAQSAASRALLAASLAAALLAGACSGGGSSGSTSASAKLEITEISVLEGQEWKINRPIDITFNRDVDFATVSFNTIRVSDQQGNGATGFFRQTLGANDWAPSGRSRSPSPLPRVILDRARLSARRRLLCYSLGG